MSLNLVALTVPNLELLLTHSTIVKQQVHTQFPLNRHMNGREGIHVDSYKESHLDSHQGELVSDNVTKVAPTTP